jgi:hypothetical protein
MARRSLYDIFFDSEQGLWTLAERHLLGAAQGEGEGRANQPSSFSSLSLELLRRRCKGELPTPARFIRDYFDGHRASAKPVNEESCAQLVRLVEQAGLSDRNDGRVPQTLVANDLLDALAKLV